VLAASAGLAAFIGIRVKDTLADRAALQATHATAPKADAKHAGVAITRGVPVTWKPVVPVTGTLSPVQETDIGFKVPGRLKDVRAQVGDRVKHGALLATLDAAEMSAQVAAASAGVRAAQIGLDMAKDAERRTQALFASNSVSEAEQSGAAQKTALAQAQLDQARAQQSLAATSAGNAVLKAPFAGLVTRVPSGIGRIVNPGEALFHLEDTSVLRLNATLSEADAQLVEVGAPVTIGNVTGKVTTVLPSLDPTTRRVPMLAEFTNDGDKPLFARAFVRASIAASREVHVLKLPATALRPGSQDEVVLLQDGKAQIKRVVYSVSEDGSLLVREGLDAAENVVVRPSAETQTGDPLSVAEAPLPAK
jgi:RND family efflux transporter MFP subunit